MSTKGTVNTSNYGGRRVTFSWEAIVQGLDSTGTPYTRIQWKLTGSNDPNFHGAISGYYMAGNFKVTLKGYGETGKLHYDTTLYQTGENDRIELWDGTQVASGHLDVPHEETTGVLNITINVAAAIYDKAQNVSGSGSFSLPTYQSRAGIILPDSFTIGGTMGKITISNYRDTCSYTITCSITGSPVVTVATKTKERSFYWQAPQSFYEYMPNKAVASITFDITTYAADGTEISTNTNFSQLIVSQTYNAPSVDSISITLNSSDTKTQSLTGSATKFILNCSKVDYSITSTGKNYATITATNMTNAGQIKYGPTGSFTSPITSNTFVATVTDSRNFQTKKEYTINAVNYIPVTCFAETTDPSANDNGTFRTTIKASGDYWSGNFGATSNTLTLYYQIRRNGTFYTKKYPITDINISGNRYTASVVVPSILSSDKYEFTVVAEDAVKSSGSIVAVNVIKPIFDWSPNDFNFNVPVTMQDSLTVAGNLDVTGDITNGGVNVFPICTTWKPTLYNGSTGSAHIEYAPARSGIAIRIGDYCIISFYYQGYPSQANPSLPAKTINKIALGGLPYEPDGTRWWAGGGNASGHVLSTDGTTFNGWCIENISVNSTPVWAICGRAGAIRSGESSSTTKSSAYIGAIEGSVCYFSGTIMYKIAAG